MPKMQKRFVVAVVNDQAYEIERTFGCPEFRICCEITAGVVVRVWAEADRPVASGGEPMANPYLDEGGDE